MPPAASAKRALPLNVCASTTNAPPNPGDALRQLLTDYGPALILIDEWVAYARQLHDESDLPAGSFETHFTFAQALSESAKLPPNCLLVISLPASDRPGERSETDDIEVGGVRGREALARLANVVGRVDSSWRPASADESFEIVRRRLFQQISEAGYTTRDNVTRAYLSLYKSKTDEFPAETKEADYEKRMREAYPVHPEVFERLYSDWSTLPSFQRTRGVLRLMAAVIHTLWASGDRNPLILPASIPLDDGRVQFELTRYLPANWAPVIERGHRRLRLAACATGRGVPNLGRHNACRRVARAVFLGSAPTPGAANQGLDERRIKLGCAMPGESVSDFGDALRRLARQCHLPLPRRHPLLVFDPTTVANLAADRAEDLRRDPHKVEREIEKRLRENFKQKGEFRRVHLFPESGQDVQDDMEVGLVVLNVRATHTSGMEDSPALGAARDILESRGNAPRLFRNALLFLAADGARHQTSTRRPGSTWAGARSSRIATRSTCRRTRCARPNNRPNRPMEPSTPASANPSPGCLCQAKKLPNRLSNGRKSVCAGTGPWPCWPATACSTTRCS